MRIPTVILNAGVLAIVAAPALAGHAAYSNFSGFQNNPGVIGQASAVTSGNAPMIEPFVSNTASMRVVFDEAASANTLSILSPMLYLRTIGGMPGENGLGESSAGPLDPRDGAHQHGGVGDLLSNLAPLRVSIYASAADVESRNAHASFDYTPGMIQSSIWGQNSGFMAMTFDFGPTLDFEAGDWFFEIAQVDPSSAQFFLALGAGEGMHLFNENTQALQGSNFEFALEIGTSVVIPIPAAGSLGVAGLIALGARFRRRAL